MTRSDMAGTDWRRVQSATIDWLRPAMAFMVVCLHVQLFYTGRQWALGGGAFDVFVIVLCKTLCPVAVPTFFFISGYLFFQGLESWDSGVWKRKMTRRVRTLLVPYVLWNLIALAAFPLTRLGGSLLKGTPMAADSLWDVIRERGLLRLFWDRTLFDGVAGSTTNLLGWCMPSGQPMDTPLWFVRDLMVVVLFTPVIHWLVRKTGAATVAVLGALFLADVWIPVPGFGIKATFFFVWGSLFAIKGKSFAQSFRKVAVPVGLLFLVGLALIPFLWDGHRKLFQLAVRLFIIIAVMFSLGTVSLLIGKGVIRPSGWLAGSSFFVYCSHMVVVASAVMWAVMSLPFRSAWMQILLFVAGAALTYLICHLIFMVLQRCLPSVANVLTGQRLVNS